MAAYHGCGTLNASLEGMSQTFATVSMTWSDEMSSKVNDPSIADKSAFIELDSYLAD